MPIDIARVSAFLASQDGEWINGKIIGIDGAVRFFGSDIYHSRADLLLGLHVECHNGRAAGSGRCMVALWRETFDATCEAI